MDFLSNSVDTQTVLIVGAIAVFFLLSRLLFRLLNVGTGTILAIVAVVLVLKYGFDISPKALWFEVTHLPQMAARFVQSVAS